MTEAQGIDGYLAIIDEARAQPFGQSWTEDPGFSAAGCDFHLVTLHVSQSWPRHLDEDDACRAAYDQFERELYQLVHALTARWGKPETADVLSFYYEHLEGNPVPALNDHLCEMVLVDDLHGWSVGQRWVSVSLGHPDQEAPFILFVAIADASLPTTPPEA